jgi:hypothetical protein
MDYWNPVISALGGLLDAMPREQREKAIGGVAEVVGIWLA